MERTKDVKEGPSFLPSFNTLPSISFLLSSLQYPSSIASYSSAMVTRCNMCAKQYIRCDFPKCNTLCAVLHFLQPHTPSNPSILHFLQPLPPFNPSTLPFRQPFPSVSLQPVNPLLPSAPLHFRQHFKPSLPSHPSTLHFLLPCTSFFCNMHAKNCTRGRTEGRMDGRTEGLQHYC
jgi:hypothetical protein